MSEARDPAIVGIDLGTTNSAIAWCSAADGAEPELFAIPQLIGEGEVGTRDGLASAIYLAGESDVPAGVLALPWQADSREAVGEYGRRLGARRAGRLVASAKSWLSHPGVDRRQPLLPWGSDEVARVSPVDASARILKHLAAAWEQCPERSPAAALAEQDLILTVPASFDEVARELTVEAAAAAGLHRLRLLEEPQAALYAWAAAHADWRERLGAARTILVVDVGGGTTDFSLVEVRDERHGRGLERTFVGRHLLLGGDNMDLAIARQVHAASGVRLDAPRWQQLTALCRDAKERLLGTGEASAEIALAGQGRSVVAGTVRATLAREDVIEQVLDGFFPFVDRAEGPRETDAIGLQDFGLPYESDPAITRHLAAFLCSAESAHGRMPTVDAILFNGGALQPQPVRERVLDVVASWQENRPVELAGADLDRAVARGAAIYGLALRGHGERISGGAARSFYLGIGRGADAEDQLLCLTSRGMEEGDELALDEPALELVANRPARFPLFTSTTRLGDVAGSLLPADAEGLSALPPLGTVLRFGRSLEERTVPVRLRALLAETGTLEVACESRETDHRWKLSFDLRAQATSSEWEGAEPARDEAEAEVSEQRTEAARRQIETAFSGDADPIRLMKQLEDALGLRRDGWPLRVMRELWDVLFAFEAARARSPEHEARWLNLSGYLLRPGYGDARDEWRGEQLWRLHDAGPRNDTSAQVRSEWWTLWKRAAGALSRPQQTALLQDLRPALLPSARRRRGRKGKGSSHALREMWQVAGSLERLPSAVREEVFSLLAARVADGRRAAEPEVWALGRLGARVPLYGPADSCVRPAVVVDAVETILASDAALGDALSLALAQMGRVSGDLARDLPGGLRERLAVRLAAEEAGGALAELVREGGELEEGMRARMSADSLPSGLQLALASGTGGG